MKDNYLLDGKQIEAAVELGRTQRMLSFGPLMELAAALIKVSNEFIVKGIQADDVNAIPFEEFSYDIIMALVALREDRPLLFDALDKGVDGMLYSHASAHEFELMMAQVNEDDGKPQYVECDEQFSRNLMDQLAKDLDPNDVPF